VEGRVIDPATESQRAGEYVVGWAKRGPFGVIGTNKPDAVATVEAMLADLPTLAPASQPDPAAIVRLLSERQVRFISLADWRILDQIEMTLGAAAGRPRVKFTRTAEMLAVLAAQP
jgi:ferredoxin--NADP+ reductase